MDSSINSLVAEGIMGFKYIEGEDDHWINEKGEYQYSMPKYSTNIFDAWLVVERLREQGILLTVETLISSYRCSIDNGFNGVTYESTASLAICKAALKVIGVVKDE